MGWGGSSLIPQPPTGEGDTGQIYLTLAQGPQPARGRTDFRAPFGSTCPAQPASLEPKEFEERI